MAAAAGLLVLLAWTSPGECRWQTWSKSDGLSQNGVYSMLEDRSGALWFGTVGGVSRYDGVSWRTFTTADGLADNDVLSMLEDRTGALWFATIKGVSRYDGVSWRTFTTADGLPDDAVYSMLEDRSGALWFGTVRGVSRYDGVSWRTFTVADGLANNGVFSMLEDRSGALWFGTDGGVSRYDGVNWRTFTTADGLASSIVFCIVEDHGGMLWFATNNSVSRYDGVNWRTFTAADGLAGPYVHAIVEDRSGVLWFATDGGGVSRYDGVSWRTFSTADGLASNSAVAILEDRSGALWFGTEGGVSRYDGVDWRTFTTADGLADNDVLSMLEDRGGALWFGFGPYGGGVSRYDRANWRTFTTADGLADSTVSSMFEDQSGALWFGTRGGVSRYDGVNWRTLSKADGLADNTVLSMLEDRNGAMWFGTGGGVSRYDGVNWRTFTSADGLAGNAVYSMLEDRNGALWLATRGSGVSRYDGVNWRTFTTADGLASNAVTAMLEDRSGGLWFGTDAGVSRYDGSTWRTLTMADGLADNGVTAMLEDRSGALWFGSYGRGVSRYDGVHWRTFTSADGLVSDIVYSMLEDRGGAMWFGTDRGVTTLTPDRVAPRSVFATRPLALSATRVPLIAYQAAFNDVGIEFQYSLDREPWSPWSTVGAWPSTALPDGGHEFEVRGRDYWGNIESPPESLTFEIDATPPAPSIFFPGAGAAVRDSVSIRGTAADARFRYYRLEARPEGAATWTALVDSARAPVTNGVLGGWNTRGLPDGSYELRLQVADTLGLVGTSVVPVQVDNRFPFAVQTSPALVTAATGGDVYTIDAAAHLYIPPHGLARDTVVTVTALDTTEVPAVLPGGVTRASSGFEVGWGTVPLTKTATLDLPGAGGAGAVVYVEGADSTWTRVGGTVDPRTARETVPVRAAGRYALFLESAAAGSSGAARLSAITMTPRVFSPSGGYAASSVAIGFTLGRAGPVTVKVYNRAGRLVREVASDLQLGAGANVVRWDGHDGDGKAVEEGPYVVSIGALGETQSRVLAVVRR